MIKLLFAPICLLILFALGSADKLVTPETSYYYGKVMITSADGATPYGPPKFSLVKRTLNRANSTISEFVTQGAESFDTQMTRIAHGNVFNATDAEGSFKGTLSFSDGEDWLWEYDITMTDGSGKITGSGTLDDEGIKTEKYFEDKDGNRTVRITEVLNSVTQAEYEQKLAGK